MNNYQLLPIDESYNSQMLPILEASPIHAGGLSVLFDKSPDLFRIPGMKYSPNHHIGFFEDKKLKGFASMGFYDAYVQGQVEKVFTFYHFYLLPEARGKRLAELAMKEFFAQIPANVNYGLTVTMKGNRPAESYIGRQVHDWMPPSRTLDELVVKSILFSFPLRNKTKYTVTNADMDDIPEIVNLLNSEHRQRDFGLPFEEINFVKVLNKRNLDIINYYVARDRKGEIRGVCLAWDCGSFRRTKVLKYTADFYPALLAYKAMEKVFPMAPFPAKGESFREITITDYAVANRDPEIMHALLGEIYYRNLSREYHFMNFASCRTDTLLKAARGFWHKDIVSHIAFTSLDQQRYSIPARLPYIDIAFL